MTIQNNTDKLMDNLRLDEIQVYGVPDGFHDVYLDYFTQFYDWHLDSVSVISCTPDPEIIKLFSCSTKHEIEIAQKC